MDQALQQNAQQDKAEIEFNAQVHAKSQQEKTEREPRQKGDCEKEELKRRQAAAEWKAEEKRHLARATLAELLTVDQVVPCLWHSAGRDVQLVALNKLGGFGATCPFEMTIVSVFYEAMQQDRAGGSAGLEQCSTTTAHMRTALNTADVLIVHTASGTDSSA